MIFELEGMCSDPGHKTRAGTTGVVFWLIVEVVIMNNDPPDD